MTKSSTPNGFNAPSWPCVRIQVAPPNRPTHLSRRIRDRHDNNAGRLRRPLRPATRANGAPGWRNGAVPGCRRMQRFVEFVLIDADHVGVCRGGFLVVSGGVHIARFDVVGVCSVVDRGARLRPEDDRPERVASVGGQLHQGAADPRSGRGAQHTAGRLHRRVRHHRTRGAEPAGRGHPFPDRLEHQDDDVGGGPATGPGGQARTE